MTQSNIHEATGINPDTIRKLEKGLVIPKYETLEILGHLYKVDLLNILRKYSKDQTLSNLYFNIDQSIVSHNIDQLHTLNDMLEADAFNNSPLVNPTDLKSLKTFTKYMHSYYDEHMSEEEMKMSIEALIQCLKLTVHNFDFENYLTCHYSPLEIRLLLLIALYEVRLDELIHSTEIFKFCLDYLIQDREETIWHMKLIMKLFFNLSYNHHRLSDYTESLNVAIEGIKYAKSKHIFYNLANLMTRKGIAEYHLGMAHYLKTLEHAMVLLEVFDDSKTAELYKKILNDKYKLSL